LQLVFLSKLLLDRSTGEINDVHFYSPLILRNE
jgi:hypothetical protein